MHRSHAGRLRNVNASGSSAGAIAGIRKRESMFTGNPNQYSGTIRRGVATKNPWGHQPRRAIAIQPTTASGSQNSNSAGPNACAAIAGKRPMSVV